MGQNTSDYYFVQDEKTFSKQDIPLHYIWLDANINGPQNRQYLLKFEKQCSIYAYDNIQRLKCFIQNFDCKKKTFRVICPSSLDAKDYLFIQNHENIDRVILFCMNSQRADALRKKYSKIKKACFKSSQVIETIKVWQSQIEILLVESDQFGRLNKLTANWRGLVDENNIHPQKAMQDWQIYCAKWIKKKISDVVSQFTEQLLVKIKVKQNDSALIAFIQQQMDSQNLDILTEINSLLRLTNNPFKLAYIRYLTSIFYKAIKSHYNITDYKKQTYYGTIILNQEQKKKLIKGNIFTFNHFFSVRPIKAFIDEELDLEIVVQQKQKCEGYITSEKRIIFNLGNFFRIQQYLPEQKKLTISLIQFKYYNEQKQQSLIKQIHLNQTWMMNQQNKFQGQWLSLIINKQQDADRYIKTKIEEQQKQNKKNKIISSMPFKWKVNQQVLKIPKNIPIQDIQIIQISLGDLIVDNQNVYEKLLVFSALAHLYLIRQQTYKLKSIIEQITKQQQKEVANPIADNDLGIKIKIIKIAYSWLFDQKQTNLDCVENQLKTRSIQFQADQLYHFLLEVKILCLESKKKYAEELNSIIILRDLYSICKGKNCPEFTKLRQKKIVIEEIKNKLTEEQNAKKLKLCTSKVSRKQLLQNYNQSFKINVSSIDFGLLG